MRCVSVSSGRAGVDRLGLSTRRDETSRDGRDNRSTNESNIVSFYPARRGPARHRNATLFFFFFILLLPRLLLPRLLLLLLLALRSSQFRSRSGLRGRHHHHGHLIRLGRERAIGVRH